MRRSIQSPELALFLPQKEAISSILKKTQKNHSSRLHVTIVEAQFIQTMLITVQINTRTMLLTWLSVEMH